MSIIKELKKHLKREKVSFHMPGHKSGKLFKRTELKSKIWELDTTELSDTDCLHNPKDFLRKAQLKAANVYGARESFFLVNGATCGILAMFFAAFKEGDKVIVSRDCHKSVINAIVFSGVIPVYIAPLIDEEGISIGVDKALLQNEFEKNPDCKGVFITSPTYYGVMSDIEGIAEITHKNHALLLCDEAHGAHFPFSDEFPKCAIKQGADMSVVSLHKTMPSPNQTAILHLGNCDIDALRVQKAVNMFQTTSPSYVLMSAMEQALDFGIKYGKILTEKIVGQIPKGKSIKCFDDPFKIVLDFSKKGYSGEEVLEILEKKFGIYCEMAQNNYVLLILSWGNTRKDFARLIKAMNYIDSLPDKEIKRKKCQLIFENISSMTPKEVMNKEAELVELDSAIGRIAKEEVTSFPPCIPFFMPGERIEKYHIEMIKEKQKEGANITGLNGDLVCVVKDR